MNLEWTDSEKSDAGSVADGKESGSAHSAEKLSAEHSKQANDRLFLIEEKRASTLAQAMFVVAKSRQHGQP